MLVRNVSQPASSTTFLKRISFLLSFTALTVVFTGLSASAETVDSAMVRTETAKSVDSPATKTQSNSATTPAYRGSETSSVPVRSPATPIPGKTLTSASALLAQPHQTSSSTVAQVDNTTTPNTTTPGTVPPSTTTPETTPPSTTTPGTVPPNTTTPSPNEVVPGRATRSGSSYIGVAGNIGVLGDTALGDSNFAVISKIGLTRNVSVRPSVVIGDNTTFLIPITLDFPLQGVENTQYTIAPYVGAGAALATGGGSTARLLLTGGVDVPLGSQFTATAAANAAVFDGTDLGITIGVGYNFPGGF